MQGSMAFSSIFVCRFAFKAKHRFDKPHITNNGVQHWGYKWVSTSLRRAMAWPHSGRCQDSGGHRLRARGNHRALGSFDGVSRCQKTQKEAWEIPCELLTCNELSRAKNFLTWSMGSKQKPTEKASICDSLRWQSDFDLEKTSLLESRMQAATARLDVKFNSMLDTVARSATSHTWISSAACRPIATIPCVPCGAPRRPPRPCAC
jgi:hypothetical protein